MISAFLQTNKGTKNHQLFTYGYIKETAGDLNDRTMDLADTKKAWTAESTSREFCDPLHLDFLQQNRRLLSQVNMRIRLIRA